MLHPPISTQMSLPPPQNVASPLPDSLFVYVVCVYVWTSMQFRNCMLSPSITCHLIILRWNLSLNLELSHSAWLASQVLPRTLCSPLPGLGVPITTNHKLLTSVLGVENRSSCLHSSPIVFFIELYHSPIQLQIYLFVVWIFCLHCKLQEIEIFTVW